MNKYKKIPKRYGAIAYVCLSKKDKEILDKLHLRKGEKLKIYPLIFKLGLEKYIEQINRCSGK